MRLRGMRLILQEIMSLMGRVVPLTAQTKLITSEWNVHIMVGELVRALLTIKFAETMIAILV